MSDTHGRHDSLRLMLDLVRTCCIVVVSAAATWALLLPSNPTAGLRVDPDGLVPTSVARTRPEPRIPTEPISLDSAWTEGASSAPVVAIVYSDFQCPFCAQFVQQTLSGLRAKYVSAGSLRVAFKHLPLEQIHPFALPAAVAAECAGAQGEFWAMHDKLFERQSEQGEDLVSSVASDLGLDVELFNRCRATGASTRIQQNVDEARRLGITGTPTILIGTPTSDGRVAITQRLSGTLGVEPFSRIVDPMIASARGAAGPTGG